MLAQLRGAAGTGAQVRFDANRVPGFDLIVDQAVQKNFSFVAVHFCVPSAAPTPPQRVTSSQGERGRPASRPRVDRGPGGPPIADIAPAKSPGRLLNFFPITRRYGRHPG
jgi:hypothetical protein